LHRSVLFGGPLDRHKLLIVSYLFPPVGGIGVQRALSLAKYLPRCGFEVHILKGTNAGGPVHDPDLLRQVPPEVLVHQAWSPEVPFAIRQKLWSRIKARPTSQQPRNATGTERHVGFLEKVIKRVLCPEPEILWVPFAMRQARRIIRQHRIGSVLVTVPPFSALLVGTAMKRAFPSIKLISDFRDEWLSFYLKDFEFQNNDHTRRRATDIERETVEYSDLVVAVNQSSRDEIRRRYPREPDRKFQVVSNGYDPEVFAAFEPRPNPLPRMLITHMGTLYKTASPRYFLDAMDRLPEEIRTKAETRFLGRVSDTERALLDNRKHLVNVMGFMPQAEALKWTEETDYLLLTMTNEISVPGKLFEYMATGKPILAVTPRGSEVDRILQHTGGGICAPPDDQEAILAMLTRAFNAWRTGTPLVGHRKEAVRCYERPRLAQEYARMINQ
jgi:glycosyltransferase involved in cell wall biosynthesis